MNPKAIIRIFLAGDVFGSGGLACIIKNLPQLIQKEAIDFVVVNAENTSGGSGVSESDAQKLFDAGADVLTGGNHSFEKKDYASVLETDSRVLRPANFPNLETYHNDFFSIEPVPGRGACIIEKQGVTFAVLNLQGRESMPALDCPFRAADAQLALWSEKDAIILVDFHAESTMEKEALGFYLDGRVSAVVGTHTHVQTADERILPQGTAFMSDLGMTGPINSVIGSDPDLIIKRNIRQVLYKMEESKNPSVLQGLIIEVDRSTKKAVSVKRVSHC